MNFKHYKEKNLTARTRCIHCCWIRWKLQRISQMQILQQNRLQNQLLQTMSKAMALNPHRLANSTTLPNCSGEVIWVKTFLDCETCTMQHLPSPITCQSGVVWIQTCSSGNHQKIYHGYRQAFNPLHNHTEVHFSNRLHHHCTIRTWPLYQTLHLTVTRIRTHFFHCHLDSRTMTNQL